MSNDNLEFEKINYELNHPMDTSEKYSEDPHDYEGVEVKKFLPPEVKSAWESMFGNSIPSGIVELQDWIQQFSNRTGYTGRLGGYNVRPQRPNSNAIKGFLFWGIAIPAMLLIMAYISGMWSFGICWPAGNGLSFCI